MKGNKILYVIAILLAIVLMSCIASQVSWSIKENSFDSFRETVGLSSLAVGNLNPSARNPGYELFCTGLNDVPGGYCNYFTLGVPSDNFSLPSFTIEVNSTEKRDGK